MEDEAQNARRNRFYGYQDLMRKFLPVLMAATFDNEGFESVDFVIRATEELVNALLDREEAMFKESWGQ